MRLAELTAAIARAADVASGLPPDTALRTCLGAVALARADGLGDEEVRDVFHAALLRHAGCTAAAHEETRLVGDDLDLRTTMGLADAASPRDALPRVLSLGKGRGPVARVRAVTGFMRKAGQVVQPAFRSKCEVAIRFAVRIGLGPRVERALAEAYERWDGKGMPAGARGDALSRAARIIGVAELAASFLAVGGAAAAREVVRARAGGQVDPAVAVRVDHALEAMRAPSSWDAVLAAEPTPHASVGAERLTALAELLADFADLKSVWLLGHSREVAKLAATAGAALGIEPTALATAALLHDVGRAAISNAIWDKPGALEPGELELARSHAYQTERILAPVAALRPFARLASMAHERHDGSGYHRGVAGSALDTAARVLAAADVAQALGAARPHRPALAPDAIVKAMRADEALDRRAVEAVLLAAGAAPRRARASYPGGLSEREVEVLRLVAHGLTDKEIADRLGISHRTVHHHNQHAFDKLGVSTRAAAALFLIENDLL